MLTIEKSVPMNREERRAQSPVERGISSWVSFLEIIEQADGPGQLACLGARSAAEGIMTWDGIARVMV